MFVHHVFFWLNEPDNLDAYNQLEEGLNQLSTIDTIQMVHIGKPAGTNRDVIDSSYTFSLLTVFENETDHDIYQHHPIHENFIQTCGQLWNKVLVYDSE
jgi:hypothetical protein